MSYVPMDRETLENLVRELTVLGDVWRMRTHVIYVVRDGISPGTTAAMLIELNRRLSIVLETMMALTGQLVTDAMIDDVIEFVEGTADNEPLDD